MLRYGGGGHHAAGTCQIDTPDADRVRAELVAVITADHAARLQRRSA
jgi:nanoRNase/pAp phosphatase (c-di-AMP/oligoRNAs hydrolase)